MTTVFHARPYGRFIEIQNNVRRKKVHRTSQDSNFLGDSFSNRDNIRVPNQFRRERQPQLHKRLFFLKNRPINFHIKQKKFSFSSTAISKPLPAPSPQCLVDQIQVQQPSLVVATDQMPDRP